MACTDPGSRSPGHLVWFYTLGAALRAASISLGLNNTVDISNVAVLQVEADRIAALFKACTTNKVTQVDWGIKLPSGHVYYRAPLTTGAGVGTHGLVSADYYYSQMVALVGHGIPLTAGGCAGPITARLHIAGALAFTAGQIIFPAATDAAFLALVNGINASTFVAADFYGRGGNITRNLPVQFNAHTQKKWGT